MEAWYGAMVAWRGTMVVWYHGSVVPKMSWHDTMTGCWKITRFCSETKNSGPQTIVRPLKIPHRKVDKGATVNAKCHKMPHTKVQKKYFPMLFIHIQSQKNCQLIPWSGQNLGATCGTSIPHSEPVCLGVFKPVDLDIEMSCRVFSQY